MEGNPKRDVERLLAYGLYTGMICEEDQIPVRNALLSRLNLEYEDITIEEEELCLTDILDNLLNYAFSADILEDNTITSRDLLDSELMGIMMPRQSEVIKEFTSVKESKGVKKALEEFYHLCRSSNYIRTGRTRKNRSWKTKTVYGNLEITINLSKPEKDPKAIAAAKKLPSSGYPQCVLCKENIGYAGRSNHPARQNLRVIPLNLHGEEWFLQYSPYLYYNEHSIVICREHRPMKISRGTFLRLLSFVKTVPHYFIGSNADLPVVGGSILSHDHFQSGNHTFPMEQAPVMASFYSEKYAQCEMELLRWPLSVIRLRGENCEELTDLAHEILEFWKNYSDEENGILSHSGETPHNTITPIARRRDKSFKLDLVLRNNRTSEDRPLGIFHPGPGLHHIKKENIGLIEVMGLAILPGRLDRELRIIADTLSGRIPFSVLKESEGLEKHIPWVETMMTNTPLSADDAEELLKKEVGEKYRQVLEDAGVFKQSEKGVEGFCRFLSSMGFIQNSKEAC